MRRCRAAQRKSRTRGSARVLLATLAAVAEETSAVSGLSTDELRAAAGLADSTYRRARAALLRSNELVLEAAGGGRSNTNQWLIRDPRSINPEPVTAAARRSAPARSARPLIATARRLPPASEQLTLRTPAAIAAESKSEHAEADPGLENPGQDRTAPRPKGPRLSGVSHQNPAQDRTVSAETPPQTPPPNVRAGREPQNPRTRKHPPNPPERGSHAARSRSLRTTSPTAAARGNARSPSTSTRPGLSRSRERPRRLVVHAHA
jgi:hypothetical protein